MHRFWDHGSQRVPVVSNVTNVSCQPKSSLHVDRVLIIPRTTKHTSSPPTDLLNAILMRFGRFWSGRDRYGLLLPRKTTKTAEKAAVAAKISLFVAAVKSARHNENNAVIPAMIPIRANVFSTKYNTITPAIGSTEETTVASRDDSFVIVRSE